MALDSVCVGKGSAVFSVSLCSAQADAQVCVNDSLSRRMSAVCWLPRGLLQPAGEVSVAPYGAGKINNERKFSSTAGGLLVSPPNKI